MPIWEEITLESTCLPFLTTAAEVSSQLVSIPKIKISFKLSHLLKFTIILMITVL
jgi:hypothetical protein